LPLAEQVVLVRGRERGGVGRSGREDPPGVGLGLQEQEPRPGRRGDRWCRGTAQAAFSGSKSLGKDRLGTQEADAIRSPSRIARPSASTRPAQSMKPSTNGRPMESTCMLASITSKPASMRVTIVFKSINRYFLVSSSGSA